MIVTVILCGLMVLASYMTIAHSMMRFYFNETQAEVIDFALVYDIEYDTTVVGYEPIVKFEVGGKLYQGKANVVLILIALAISVYFNFN